MSKHHNRPNGLWARAVNHPHLQKPPSISDTFDDDVKNISLFDEIFPANKSTYDVERGGDSWHNEDTFYKAIGPILVAGQCFGVMPIHGLLGSDYTNLRFTWQSWRVVYTFLMMSLSFTMIVFCCGRIFDDGIDIYRTINLTFFASTFTSMILFLRMAPNWSKLCEAIAKEELNKNPFYYQMNNAVRRKHSLRVRFSIWSFGVLFFALVEHVLSVISGIAVAYDCPRNQSNIHNYFLNAYPQVFYFVDFSFPLALFLQPLNFTSTFSWNFMDLFIILMSVILTERLELLGDRLDLIIGKHLPEHFWRIARIEFADLAKLVRVVDQNINKIVLLSFANNLYFICLQLFQSLKSDYSAIGDSCICRQFRVITHLTYFAFSFGFLLTRSLLVSLGAAKINTASQRPAAVLYSVPSESYCTEVRRFLDQVTSDVIGLTGYNFFYVTRGLILTIAGTIVTYELVLVQFNSSPPPVTANLTISGVDKCALPGTTQLPNTY